VEKSKRSVLIRSGTSSGVSHGQFEDGSGPMRSVDDGQRLGRRERLHSGSRLSPTRALPGQAPLDFEVEREAQEGSDHDDTSKDANALKRRRGGDGADDVARDEKLESKENRALKANAIEAIRRTNVAPQSAQELEAGSQDTEDDDRDPRRIDALTNSIDGIDKIHRKGSLENARTRTLLAGSALTLILDT
jgi:hypothetical protein